MGPYREDLRLRYQDAFQRSRKHQRIGNMREGDGCFYHDVNLSKTLHCSVLVSAQEAPHCARSCASHSHQSQTVGTSWRKEPMA